MKVGIIGSGRVGSSTAYALVMQGIGREIVMVDHDQSRAEAEAEDVAHAVPFANPLIVRAGKYSDLVGCKVVVVAAGVSQKPEETRLQLLQRNADVFREVIPQIIEHEPNAILVVATNPVDIMTHIATEFAIQSGVAANRVLGSGTTLDTARFRTIIGAHFGVDSRHVHAYVVGEHGDSEVLTWSLATISGLSLQEFGRAQGVGLDEAVRSNIDDRVRRAAYRIIDGKGATNYGIGSALARIVSVILNDQRSIMTICSQIEQVAGVPNVTISMPHLFGGDGILSSIPLTLDADEKAALKVSADIVSEAIESLDLRPTVASHSRLSE